MQDSDNLPEHLILFDGICGLCNGFVDWMLKRDRSHRFRFAPLQGDIASTILPQAGSELKSILYVREGKVYQKSGAVLRVLWVLGGIWRFSAVFWILQPLFGNLVYDFVARNRYKWFGKTETCRLPMPEERAYFLP